MPKKKSKKSVKSASWRKRKNKSSNSNLRNKAIGIFFVFLSLFILLFPSYLKHYGTLSSVKVSFEVKKTQTVSEAQIPDKIVLPDVSINIAVKEAKIENGYWQTFEDVASYGQGSALLGEKGNMVIFAHARNGLFYNLRDIKKDDLVFVYNKKKKYTYKVKTIKSVFPNDTRVIAPTKDQRLTLYTCIGFYDEKRLVVVAEPVLLGSEFPLTF
jgi:LPXTG-site transpeptidase (sortase) family protein